VRNVSTHRSPILDRDAVRTLKLSDLESGGRHFFVPDVAHVLLKAFGRLYRQPSTC